MINGFERRPKVSSMAGASVWALSSAVWSSGMWPSSDRISDGGCGSRLATNPSRRSSGSLVSDQSADRVQTSSPLHSQNRDTHEARCPAKRRRREPDWSGWHHQLTVTAHHGTLPVVNTCDFAQPRPIRIERLATLAASSISPGPPVTYRPGIPGLPGAFVRSMIELRTVAGAS